MAEQANLAWFRARLEVSKSIELKDPAPLLAWRDALREKVKFRSTLIALDQVRDWVRDEGGNIRHKSGQFFGIEGVRIESEGLREVVSWDQPIYTQLDGGILAMLCREVPGHGIQFLLHAKAEPGNIGILQFCPSIQCTRSNIRQAHQGRRPPLVEVLDATTGVRIIYQAAHNEEGGRFWQKSNENMIVFLDDESVIKTDLAMFQWASLSQIKELALQDNVLSPFVKTILAPL